MGSLEKSNKQVRKTISSFYPDINLDVLCWVFCCTRSTLVDELVKAEAAREAFDFLSDSADVAFTPDDFMDEAYLLRKDSITLESIARLINTGTPFTDISVDENSYRDTVYDVIGDLMDMLKDYYWLKEAVKVVLGVDALEISTDELISRLMVLDVNGY